MRVSFAVPVAGVSKFKRSGSATEDRTIADKLDELVSVFDYVPAQDHGAIIARNSANEHTSEIQAALTDTASYGGTCQLPAGTYNIGNLTIADNVIVAGGSNGSYLPQTSKGAVLKAIAGTTGYLITFNGSVRNAGLKNLSLYGLGGGSVSQSGVLISNGCRNCIIENCDLWYHNDTALKLDKVGSSSYAHRVFGNRLFGGYRDSSSFQSGDIFAGLWVNATDNFIQDNEIQSGPAGMTIDASLRRIGLYVGPLSGFNRFVGNVIQFSDLGAVVECRYNRFTGDRFEFNLGHGLFLGRRTTGSPDYNMFIACTGYENGTAAANTYDCFTLDKTVGGSVEANKFVACIATAVTSGGPRYGFYDNGTAITTTTDGNTFIGCSTVGTFGTGKFAGQALDKMNWDGCNKGQIEITGGGSIDATNRTLFRLADAAGAAVSYTGITGGTIGTEITLWNLNEGGAVLTHGSSFRLRGQVSRVLRAYEVVTFIVTETAVTEKGSQTSAAVTAKTSNYTVTAAECNSGTHFTNVGAAGTITFSLPVSAAGYEVGFYRSASQAVRVDPNGSEAIGTGGSGKYLEIQSDKGYIRARCIVAGVWVVVESAGTIAYEP